MIITHFFVTDWCRWKPNIKLYQERYYNTLATVYKGKELYLSWLWFNYSLFKGKEYF